MISKFPSNLKQKLREKCPVKRWPLRTGEAMLFWIEWDGQDIVEQALVIQSLTGL